MPDVCILLHLQFLLRGLTLHARRRSPFSPAPSNVNIAMRLYSREPCCHPTVNYTIVRLQSQESRPCKQSESKHLHELAVVHETDYMYATFKMNSRLDSVTHNTRQNNIQWLRQSSLYINISTMHHRLPLAPRAILVATHHLVQHAH